MLVYNTIFFAECQDGNGFLFHFINFAQTQVIFYSKLTSKNIPFLLSMCSCFQSGSLRRKLCSISQLITFTKNGQELLPYIQKAAEDTSTMGRVLGGIRLSGMLRSENVLLYSFLSASTIFSGGGTKIFRLIGFSIKGCYFATAPKSAFS